jgi:hypothetical protein
MQQPDVETAFEQALSRFDGENFDRLSVSDRVLVAAFVRAPG